MMNYTKELGHKKTIIMLELKNTCSDTESLMDGFNGVGYTGKRVMIDWKILLYMVSS